MSIRSRIAKTQPDGSIKMIYCHSDGYLSGVGNLLFNHYQEESKIDQLLNLGDLSMLGSKIGEKHDFNLPFSKGFKIDSLEAKEFYEFYDTVLAYGRDRGEKDTDAQVFSSLAAIPQDFYEEFFYLRRDGKWFYSDHGTFTRVKTLTAKVCAE